MENILRGITDIYEFAERINNYIDELKDRIKELEIENRELRDEVYVNGGVSND